MQLTLTAWEAYTTICDKHKAQLVGSKVPGVSGMSLWALYTWHPVGMSAGLFWKG